MRSIDADRTFGTVAAWLAEHTGQDAVGGLLHEFEYKRAADAACQHHELPDAQVVHHPELVIHEGPPWVVDLDRSQRSADGPSAHGVRA